MAHHVCPVWVGYLLSNPLRRLVQNPERILSPHLVPGMTVLDSGCAMGFFTLPLARMTGPAGRIIAADLQPGMLHVLRKRALRQNLDARLIYHPCRADSLNLEVWSGQIDFALASAVVHEVPDQERFFTEIFAGLKPGARLLVMEPAGHVRLREFEASLTRAIHAGFICCGHPAVRRNHTALLEKTAG